MAKEGMLSTPQTKKFGGEKGGVSRKTAGNLVTGVGGLPWGD